MKTYINLGCGNRYHLAWTNFDIKPQGPGVIQHDLSRGIPLPDASCDLVYHAALLEHIRRTDVLPFLVECNRVLKPGGIIRVGVPNLERLCQLYLEKLQAALAKDKSADDDYDWIMLELYDQTIREESGGEMLAYLRQDPIPNESFIITRIGEEGRHLIQVLRRQNVPVQSNPSTATNISMGFMRRKLYPSLKMVKRHLLKLILGAEGLRAFNIGRFRLAGEVHHWMYDRYSLARLLQEAGFSSPIVQDATRSQIPDWNDFHLDALADGSIIKPDLLFMEATKTETQFHG